MSYITISWTHVFFLAGRKVTPKENVIFLKCHSYFYFPSELLIFHSRYNEDKMHISTQGILLTSETKKVILKY